MSKNSGQRVFMTGILKKVNNRHKEKVSFDKKTFLFVLQAAVIIGAVGIIFYNSLIASLVLSPLIAVYVKQKRKEERRKKEERLAQEFKDGIIAVSFSLNVGYSIENAFREARKEMAVLHGEDSAIVKEFGIICNRMSQNDNIEDILEDFAVKSKAEDILYFAEVFRYAKRSGGDLIAIIRNTAAIISDKNEVAKEINTIISGKKMEQTVMNIVPFGIILYLRLTSPEFIEPLYGNITGIIVMTACLIVYAAAFVTGRRITDIRV